MYKLCRTIHNWMGLILAIQITLWFASGLVMAWLPIEDVRGAHLRHTFQANWQHAIQSPQSVLASHSADATLALSQRLIVSEDKPRMVPVYTVSKAITENGAQQNTSVRYNAMNGAILAPLSEAEINQAAILQYAGTGKLSEVTFLSTLPQEVQQLPSPIWQVQFDDTENTRLYIDPNTGNVLRVRTDTWRLFDFMWMLHIMDYEDRSDFNHPLLIGFSAGALLFTLTGIVLLFQRFRPRKRSRFNTG
jgi:uncharacterized iron-regulated membrane protein